MKILAYGIAGLGTTGISLAALGFSVLLIGLGKLQGGPVMTMPMVFGGVTITSAVSLLSAYLSYRFYKLGFKKILSSSKE